MHREKAGSAAEVVGFVEQCSLSESIDVGDYQKAIEDLSSMQLSFEDVQMFLFKPKLNVLLNLVGLHYCIFCLEMPADHVMDTLVGCNILERKVHVKWWKLGRWFYGFRMRDESCSCWVSLEDLLTGKGEEVLGVLRRGAVHECTEIECALCASPCEISIAGSTLNSLVLPKHARNGLWDVASDQFIFIRILCHSWRPDPTKDNEIDEVESEESTTTIDSIWSRPRSRATDDHENKSYDNHHENFCHIKGSIIRFGAADLPHCIQRL
ncbi:hypothetical protein H0E87_015154 [Populus deltoides]|uniref:Uncharacterized protein n=1 Tax=Populus deltoides TaxID=3696 RepID=A0A8T2Y3U0_POPDE|nr:hypothetical protein H0E87_015154 [Populus deltoides]